MSKILDNNILVSISCITFNHAEFINKCVDSFLKQKTNFEFEIVIHDDASTDGTVKIIKEYASKYPNIINPYFQRENQYSKGVRGIMANFNFPRCKGKYIALCEGDDFWTDPYKLQKQVDFLEANPEFSLCFHNATVLRENVKNGSQETLIKDIDKSIFYTQDILRQWFIPTASMCFRNYETLSFPEWFYKTASGDIALQLLLSLHGPFKYLDEVMSVYRIHGKGISQTHLGYHKVFSMVYLYKNFDQFSEFKFTKELDKAMIYETNKHLPHARELRHLKRQIRSIKKDNFIKAYLKLKDLF